MITNNVKFGKYIKPLIIAGDFMAINAAFWLTLWAFAAPWTHPKWMWLVLNAAWVITEVLFPLEDTHRTAYVDRTLLYSVKASALTMLVTATLLYALDIFDLSPSQAGVLGLLIFILLTLWRSATQAVLKKIRRMGFNFRRVIIIGAGPTAAALYRELQLDTGFGYRLMGFFDDNPVRLASMPSSFSAPLSEVEPFVRTNNIDLIYYTLDGSRHELIAPVMRLADELAIEFVYLPRFNPMLAGQFKPGNVGMLPSMVHTFSPLTRTTNRLIKRLLDICISTVFLAVSPVIFIPIAIAIKATSRGPVFFRQKRTGIYGSEFVCYKFRTMRVNAEADRMQATENDPRKTRLGDFLRRSSIDELPQFFNVLLGNMSVVGPRPHMVSHTEEYMRLIDQYMIRHAVKPGITGWAQVNGYRGGTKHLWQMEKRVQYDVWYITNWNIFLDIKIIFMTALNGIRGDKNAY